MVVSSERVPGRLTSRSVTALPPPRPPTVSADPDVRDRAPDDRVLFVSRPSNSPSLKNGGVSPRTVADRYPSRVTSTEETPERTSSRGPEVRGLKVRGHGRTRIRDWSGLTLTRHHDGIFPTRTSGCHIPHTDPPPRGPEGPRRSLELCLHWTTTDVPGFTTSSGRDRGRGEPGGKVEETEVEGE